MKYYVCTFSDNWADEMDLEGFCLMTEDEKDEMIKDIKKRFRRGGSICFGTNEDNDYSDADEVLATLSYEQITKAEFDTIARVIGTSFGEQGPMDGSGGNWDDEDEDEDEDTVECIKCGRTIYEYEGDICSICEEEKERRERQSAVMSRYLTERVNSVIDFIQKTYGIQVKDRTRSSVDFLWKPTPKSEFSITIIPDECTITRPGKIKLNLKHNNKEVKIENLSFEEYNRRQQRLKTIIDTFINKAKECYG